MNAGAEPPIAVKLFEAKSKLIFLICMIIGFPLVLLQKLHVDRVSMQLEKWVKSLEFYIILKVLEFRVFGL